MGRTCSSTISDGRHVFELLADLLADARALAAAVGAGPLFGRDVVHDPLAGQARRQGLAAVAFGRRFRRRGRLRVRASGSGSGSARPGFEDLAAKSKSWSGSSFSDLLAVAPAEELFELVLELGVEVGLLAEGLEQLADEPVGGLEVVGEWGVEFDRRHTINTDADRRCD